MGQRHSLVCVNVVGGGYDFAKVKPLLLSLPNELSQPDMVTLRGELMAQGNVVAHLSSSLSDAVPNAISVFFNPATSDVMIEAAIKDVIDKLQRGAELLESGAIAATVLGGLGAVALPPTATSHPAPTIGNLPDAPPLTHNGSLGLGQVLSSGSSC